jgi:hypothetical protein
MQAGPFSNDQGPNWRLLLEDSVAAADAYLSAKHLGTMLLSLRTSAVLCEQSQLFERFLAVALVHVQGFLSLNHLNRYDFLHTPPIMVMEGQTSLNDSLDW